MLQMNHKPGMTTDATYSLDEMDKYYYNNKDLKLLLDLLATNSGVVTSLRVLALFDKSLREKCKPGDLTFSKPHYHERKTETNIANEEGVTERIDKTKVYDIGLRFSDAPASNQIFAFLKSSTCLYTIEILPPTPNFSVEAVKVRMR